MIVVAAGVLFREDRVLVTQRGEGAHQGLLWEFPGGKLEIGESPEAALERELYEELGVQTRCGRVLDAVFHRYPERDVLVLFYEAVLLSGEPRALDCRALQWALPGKIAALSFAPADRTFAGRFFKYDG